MKFRTAYDHPFEYPVKDYPCHDPDYRMVINPDTGLEELTVVGNINFVERMKHDAVECCLSTQLDRAGRTGDNSFLGESVDGFIDTLSYPRSFMEMENIRANSRQLWNSLPSDIRDQYGNNVRVFLKDVDSKLLKKQQEKLAAQVSSEVNNG